jgi:hypothetical protein
LERKNFFDPETYDSLRRRLESLTDETTPEWGRMSSAQMLAHCAEVSEVAAGKPLVGTPWFVKLARGLIKRMVLSEKPYPRGTGTHPQYVIRNPVDFEEEKARLLSVLAKLYDRGPEGAEQTPHELFGHMSGEDSGWVAYKHLDHHLTQFGV